MLLLLPFPLSLSPLVWEYVLVLKECSVRDIVNTYVPILLVIIFKVIMAQYGTGQNARYANLRTKRSVASIYDKILISPLKSLVYFTGII